MSHTGGCRMISFLRAVAFAASLLLISSAQAACPYDYNCLNNPYGAGNPYAPNGLMNPYSQYGSPYSNKSWSNPYATQAPQIFDEQGNYHGRLSTNPYDPNSTSIPMAGMAIHTRATTQQSIRRRKPLLRAQILRRS